MSSQFMVGTRKFTVTDDTKITKDGAAAQMNDITPGEQVSGSYWKKEDGMLAAKSVKLGVKKTEAAAPATNAQKKEDRANAASQSASPKP